MIVKVPDWYPGAEAKPAPEPLLKVQAFVNTRHVDDGWDALSNPDVAAGWLQDAGLIAAGETVSDPDLALARALRESIRGLLESDRGVERQLSLAPLREIADAHAARLEVGSGGRLSLGNPHHRDLRDGLFDLLLIIRQAQEDGSWGRLKACMDPECRWAFYDRSRNQQGSWCNMATCGNRHKNRELRARRRDDSPGESPLG